MNVSAPQNTYSLAPGGHRFRLRLRTGEYHCGGHIHSAADDARQRNSDGEGCRGSIPGGSALLRGTDPDQLHDPDRHGQRDGDCHSDRAQRDLHRYRADQRRGAWHLHGERQRPGTCRGTGRDHACRQLADLYADRPVRYLRKLHQRSDRSWHGYRPGSVGAVRQWNPRPQFDRQCERDDQRRYCEAALLGRKEPIRDSTRSIFRCRKVFRDMDKRWWC